MAGKSLNELEAEVWPEPTGDSYLVTTCHRLHTKPIDEFTVEDLRIMIGQRIGLPHLIPLAVGVLEREPLAEGHYYPGDLLASVIGTADWLQSHADWQARVVTVAERVMVDSRQANRDLRVRLVEFLRRL